MQKKFTIVIVWYLNHQKSQNQLILDEKPEMGEPEKDQRKPSSPESRLQPEDLSVSSATRPKNSPPPTVQQKPPELKLSVRKLLGCTPSPPPVRPSRSPSPEDLRSVSPIVRPPPTLVVSFPIPHHADESIKGEHLFFIK